MSMNEAPRSNRIHIGIFGKRNTGKSSLINLITDQPVSLVSSYAGTTTDPVFKNMEINPLGPVTFIDTAGFDDEGEIGLLRIAKTEEVLAKTDVALLVLPADGEAEYSYEKEWTEKFRERKIPVAGILSRSDLIAPEEAREKARALSKELGIEVISASSQSKSDRYKVIALIIKNTPAEEENDILTSDLYREGEVVVLVMPQDRQAPKGRLILPQVQVIRDILDHGGLPFATVTEKLPEVLASLKNPPALVITDSQVFAEVNRMVPREVPLTSFSVIMARNKGDLGVFARGAEAIEKLRPDSKILIAESCTHAPLTEDIGREKIPAMLRKRYGEGLVFDIAAGISFPENIKQYDLILHCGGCMFTRRQLMTRLIRAEEEKVPVTNYGIAIAKITGILERVTEMFPEIKK